MEKTIDNLETGDILYYVFLDYCQIAKFGYRQTTPIIGEFKITRLDIITSEKYDISDRYEEPNYINRPCNKVKISIIPNDEKGNFIMEHFKDMWFGKDFKKPFVVTRGDNSTHTCGRGTNLNLFTSKKAAINECIAWITREIPSDEDITAMKEIYKHNKEELNKLNEDMENENKKIQDLNKKIQELNYDCVSVTEVYELLTEIKRQRSEHKDHAGVESNEHVDDTNAYVTKVMLNPRLPEGRGTYCEGNILCKDDEDSTVYVSLFVNGNNGSTVVSTESLQPIMDYIRCVESGGGKAFISGTSYHSDVYYYCVTTIYWK